MADYVVLKRLTGKSDLGWFHSIHTNRGLAGNQKGIILNKRIINKIWPSLLTRQAAYEAAKAAEIAANAPGGAGPATAEAEKANARVAGHLPVRVELHGPEGKAPFVVSRLLALQDKNWRLNGAFIEDPLNDPARFDPILKDGDMVIIGFDGVEEPTNAVVALFAAGSATDATLVADLSARVSEGTKSMIRLMPDQLLAIANQHALPNDHVVRIIAGDPVVLSALEEIAQGDIVAAARIIQRRARPVNADELAAGIEANAHTGHLGERMVNSFLRDRHQTGGLAYKWMWPASAAHTYDFEVLNSSGQPDHVIDAKSTSSVWKVDFYMSWGELAHAATSAAPYLIYRLSEVGQTGAWLRTSEDIRSMAAEIVQALTVAAPLGTKVTTVSVSPLVPGMRWSSPCRLPAIPT